MGDRKRFRLVMDISVIIVNWNTRQVLEECLRSLTVGVISRSVEIIVVDNGSSDGSAKMVIETSRGSG